MPGVAAIAVFGASGRTGQALIAAARARGVAVHALYRRSRLPSSAPEGVTPVHGDLRQPADVERTLEQTQAAACVFGPNRAAPEAFCAEATAVVLGAMAATRERKHIRIDRGELPNVLAAATVRRVGENVGPAQRKRETAVPGHRV